MALGKQSSKCAHEVQPDSEKRNLEVIATAAHRKPSTTERDRDFHAIADSVSHGSALPDHSANAEEAIMAAVAHYPLQPKVTQASA